MLGFLFGVCWFISLYMSEETDIKDSGDGLRKEMREGYGFILRLYVLIVGTSCVLGIIFNN